MNDADRIDRLTAENATLTVERDKLKRWFESESKNAQEAVKEIARLRKALEDQKRFSDCPCCGTDMRCDKDCTYKKDDRHGWQEMQLNREVNAAIDVALSPAKPATTEPVAPGDQGGTDR